MTVTSQARCSVALEVPVTMPDQHRLYADIYFPGKRSPAAPVGVLLERGPERRDGGLRRRRAEYFAEHNYVVVVQETRSAISARGIPASEEQEQEDGRATLAWLTSQEWCGERIGVYGSGYHGYAALCAEAPTALERFAKSAHNPFDRCNLLSLRNGGAKELWHLCWQLKLALPTRSDYFRGRDPSGAPIEIDPAALLARLPTRQGSSLLREIPGLEEWYLAETALGPGDADSEITVWSERETAAVQLLGGWYSTEATSTLLRYLALERRSSVTSELVIGPWASVPGSVERGAAGELAFAAAAASLEDEMLRWFDTHLASDAAAATRTQRERVRVFLPGAESGSWLRSSRFPSVREQRLYLAGDGSLSCAAPESSDTAMLIVDTDRPVPTVGGNISALGFIPALDACLPAETVEFIGAADLLPYAGGLDQRERPGWYAHREPYLPLATRSDILSFTTPPLEHYLDVIGVVEVVLTLEPGAPDGDITAKLVDVYPPTARDPHGLAINVCDGALRLRHRFGSAAELAPVGSEIEIAVTLGAAARRFEAHHRIRLDLAGTNFPRFDVNHGGLTDQSLAAPTHVFAHRVVCAPRSSSYLRLPTVELDEGE
jgi:uncharacterized protein